MPKLQRSIVLKALLTAAAVVILLTTFVSGAALYKEKIWPFGQGFIAQLRILMGSPAPEPVFTTGLVNFDLTVHDSEELIGYAGALAVTDGGVVIAPALSGDLFYYDTESKTVHPIGLRLPDNNHAALSAEAPDGRPVDKSKHRYNDIEFIAFNGVPSLLVSYTNFDPARSCFSNRLAVLELESGWNKPGRGHTGSIDDWRIVFEAQPCLPFKSEGLNAFAGHQAGGRIAVAPNGYIYLTVGDFEFDGVNGFDYVQPRDSHYGKILRFDPKDWSVTLVSTGHRNPQGIVADDLGRVWSVEHGPMGGDELNLINDGEDYGWPNVTLGVNYMNPSNDNKNWPLSAKQGRHDSGVPPILAWVPSVGISNVKQVKSVHPRWDGDLLASSLAGQSLRRIRILGERPLYEEVIPLDDRIRYVEIGNGEIYLLFQDGGFATLTPRPSDGLETDATALANSGSETEELFSVLEANGCVECHSNPQAPSLSNIFGAAIASQAGVNYTKVLKDKTGYWSEANLRAFLADPQTFAPGTSMPKTALSSQQIDEIINALIARGKSRRDQRLFPDR